MNAVLRSFSRLPKPYTRKMTSSSSSHHVGTKMRYVYIEDVESLERYRPGGYHPVIIGNILSNRYRLVHKLGFGTNSTTWLAHDPKTATYVAVKISVAENEETESDILLQLKNVTSAHKAHPGYGIIMPVLDEFDVNGPNGTHRCIVNPPARASVAAVQDASHSRLFQLPVARAIIAQLIQAVAYLHSRGIVHSDLHSGNILLRLPKSLNYLTTDQLYQQYSQPVCEPVTLLDGENPTGHNAPTHAVVPVWLGNPSESITLPQAQVFLVDFGESFIPSHAIRIYSNTPVLLRPPELYFLPNSPVSFPADIWTLACTIFSILGQRPLFEAFAPNNDWMIQEHVDTLGKLPPEWWASWRGREKWFDEQGERIDGQSRREIEERFEYSIRKPRRETGMEDVAKEEKSALIALLRAMMAYRPEERPTAMEIMGSEWMKKWALPDMQQMCQASEKNF